MKVRSCARRRLATGTTTVLCAVALGLAGAATAEPGTPFPADQVGILPVALADLPERAGLNPENEPSVDTEPINPPWWPKGVPPGSLCAVLGGATETVVDPAPISFRRVRYTGWSNAMLKQEIGVYAQPAPAAKVAQRIGKLLTDCRNSGNSVLITDNGTQSLTDLTVTPAAVSWRVTNSSEARPDLTTQSHYELRSVDNVVIAVMNYQMGSTNIAAGVAEIVAARVGRG